MPSDVIKPRTRGVHGFAAMAPIEQPDHLGQRGAHVRLCLGSTSLAGASPTLFAFLILITLMTVAAAVTLGSGLWRVIRGSRRLAALTWMVLALILLLFFGFVGLYAMAQWRERWVPNNLPMNMAKVMGVTLMRLEASIEYPNQLETERLVMFYDRLEHPREDAEAMDRHLAVMETMLGGALRGKVFWVRGSLPKLGLGGLSTHGLALGSDTSPPDWQSYGVFGSTRAGPCCHRSVPVPRSRSSLCPA